MLNFAIKEAKKAFRKNCIPVGSVIVFENKIIARAHNQKFWHAEILCIQKALKKMGGILQNCQIYCTLKPCAMCMHAIKLAKIPILIYGCENEKEINYKLEIIQLESSICKEMMQQFFKNKR